MSKRRVKINKPGSDFHGRYAEVIRHYMERELIEVCFSRDWEGYEPRRNFIGNWIFHEYEIESAERMVS